MKSYAQCCQEVGYNRETSYKLAPQLVMEYFGYLSGTCIPCKTQKESLLFKLHDSRPSTESKKIVDQYWKEVKKLEAAALDMFELELRAEYAELSEELYLVCYAEAYDRGHSSGHDEVASCMYSVVEFAQRVRNCK